MNVYKAIFKEKQGESYWDNKPLLIVASDYSNAESKAVNFSRRGKQELISISLIGETTEKTDVFQLRER